MARTGPIRQLLQNIRARREARKAARNSTATELGPGTAHLTSTADNPPADRSTKPVHEGAAPTHGNSAMTLTNHANVEVGKGKAGEVGQYQAPLDQYAGSVTKDEEGNITATAPDYAGLMNKELPALEEQYAKETKQAEGALAGAEDAFNKREQATETAVQEGKARASQTLQDVTRTAQIGREQVQGLPGRVQEDLQGIADKYKEDTNVDIDRIEGLGREAVGMAMEGKNAAAQAAVEAQQGAMRNAIAQINSDPNIPQSRKAAMLAQVKTQSSMQIASTVGANIAQFTKMQTAAMTQTMQTVGSAMTARNQSLGAMGAAEIGAVAQAHQTAAQISKGYDDMTATAYQNADQIRYNYDNLAQAARDQNNTHNLALLDSDFYVASMPTDFMRLNTLDTQDALKTDFALQLQSAGFESMQEAMQDSDFMARQNMVTSFAQESNTWWGQAIGYLSLIFGGNK